MSTNSWYILAAKCKNSGLRFHKICFLLQHVDFILLVRATTDVAFSTVCHALMVSRIPSMILFSPGAPCSAPHPNMLSSAEASFLVLKRWNQINFGAESICQFMAQIIHNLCVNVNLAGKELTTLRLRPLKTYTMWSDHGEWRLYGHSNKNTMVLRLVLDPLIECCVHQTFLY